MYTGLHVKNALFSLDVNKTRFFSADFRKNVEITNFMKIPPVGAELFRADRRTDMMKLTVAFAKFCELAQKSNCVSPNAGWHRFSKLYAPKA